MENIDNMGANNLKSLSKNNLTEAGRKKLTLEILSGMIALSCLIVGLIYTYILKYPYQTVPQLLYFFGFMLEGIPIIITGLKGIFTKNLTNAMEILVAIAIIACAFNQQLILALLIPLILNSVHILEERSILGGRDVIEGLKNMQQDTAILYENGKESIVDAKKLKVGQKIIVKSGSGIPIDGVIIHGESHIDEKSLTGEPTPVYVKNGDPVYAGTVNIDGTLIVEICKEYIDTSFSQILKLLEKSESMSTPESRIVDKFLIYYIPFVLVIASAVALITRDVSKAIAILVVSCPCGQMLASPAPMIASLSMATKKGILIKNSKFLESLTEIKTVVFDKTGTLTTGILSLTDIVPYKDTSKELLLSCAKAVAIGSTHPVSKAIVNYTEENCKYSLPLTVHEISGYGMEGKSSDGKQIVRLGKLEWIEECGCTIHKDYITDPMSSVSYVTLNNELLGYICFNDTIREKANQCVVSLKEIGVEETVMLTGDRKEPAEYIAQKAGIDKVFAKLLPQDKLNYFKKLDKADSKILAVGDGINDALILSEADVGIAMGAMGSDLAIDSADIALMNNDLTNIPYIIKLALKTKKIIYQNFILSISLSFIMIFLSAFGVINALLGSFLHNIGAFIVLFNSSRILKENNENNKQKLN